jgi:hypothetical protein
LVDSTWDTDLRVLQAVAEAEQERIPYFGVREISQKADLSQEEAIASLMALYEAAPPYIDARPLTGNDHVLAINGIKLTERGRRTVGVWPSDNVYDALLDLLGERIQTEADGEEKSKLQRFRDTVQGMSRDVVVGLMTEAVKAGVGAVG